MAGKPTPIEVTTKPATIPFDLAAFRLAKATEILMRADQRIKEADQRIKEAQLGQEERHTPKPKDGEL